MTNKRILIYAVTDECYYKNGKYCGCGVKMGVLEDSDCASCKDRHLVGMPYDTAIEKMARAMIERYNSERTLSKWEKEWNKKNPKEAYKYFYIDAKAGIKALLEE